MMRSQFPEAWSILDFSFLPARGLRKSAQTDHDKPVTRSRDCQKGSSDTASRISGAGGRQKLATEIRGYTRYTQTWKWAQKGFHSFDSRPRGKLSKEAARYTRNSCRSDFCSTDIQSY